MRSADTQVATDLAVLQDGFRRRRASAASWSFCRDRCPKVIGASATATLFPEPALRTNLMPMSEPVLKVKLLREGACLPRRATPGSSGLDLYACLDAPVELTQDVTLVPTGIATEVPPGYDLQVRPRSGLARQGVDIIFGTLDSDYRGEVFVSMRTFGSTRTYRIEHGNRIAQLVIARTEDLAVVEVEALAESERGAGGHGSTGR